jgi:hypothetical protein
VSDSLNDQSQKPESDDLEYVPLGERMQDIDPPQEFSNWQIQQPVQLDNQGDNPQ